MVNDFGGIYNRYTPRRYTPGAESYYCYLGFRFTLRLLVVHFLVVPRYQQTPALTSECYKLAIACRS